MRKFIAILCTITLLAGTVSVSGATASDGDKDGDVVSNPWGDLFTTTAAEVTTEEITTATPTTVAPTTATPTTAAPTETTTQGTSGDDYSNLTYTTVSCDGGADLEYCVVSQNIVGWGSPWYGDAGNTFQLVYAGGDVNPADSTTVKVNGVETVAGTGAVTVIDAGLIKINPTQLTDNAYTAVEVTTATGSALIVFKKGTPGTVAPTTAAPTTAAPTTAAPTTVAPTTAAPTTVAPTTAAPTTAAPTTVAPTTATPTTAPVETTTPGGSGDDYSNLTYTTISCDGGADLEYCVVSQNIVGWGSPWYGDAGNTFQLVYAGGTVNPADSTTVKVNDVETAAGTGAVTVIDAGLIKINPTQLADNAYTAVEVTTATGSALIVFKKGTPGTAVETTAAPTTATPTTAAPTTVAPTTTEEATTIVVKPSAPTGLAQISKGYFTWISVADAVSYNIYVNETKVGSTVAAEYSNETLFATPGQYTVSVTAVNATGVESEMTTISITIEEDVTTEAPTTVAPTTAAPTTAAPTTAPVETTTQATSGDDYSNLTYTTISCNGGADLEYCVVSQNIEGWGSPWYGDAGNTFQLVYAGGTVNPADSTTVKVNDVETAAGTGAVTVIDAGLIKINPTQLADNAYTAVEVTTATGSALIVFKKGTPGTAVETTAAPTTVAPTTVAPTTEAPTTVAPTTVAPTTVAPTTVAPTTEAPTTVAPTTEAPTTDAPTTEAPTTAYDPGFNPASLAYTTLVCNGMADLTLDYAIQSATIAGLAPWYGDAGNTLSLQFSADAGVVSSVLVNGQPAADGVVTEIALGLVKVNPTKFADNAYTVIEVSTENGEFVFVVKKGTPAEIPTTEAPTTEAPTTVAPTTEAPTTVAPTTVAPTTVAPTTVAPTTVAPTTVAPTTVAPTTEAPTTAYDPGFNPASLTYTALVCDGMSDITLDYAIQSATVAGLSPWYGDAGNTLSLQFSADAGVVSSVVVNGQPAADGVVTEIALGLVKVNPTKFADNAYTVIEVSAEKGGFVFVVKKGTPAEIPTTVAPTTEAPTTVAPTTVAPTTVAPTTVAPTTEAPTTVAPTTDAPTTEAPTTQAPTTQVPTTQKPTVNPVTTKAPTTTKAAVVTVKASKVKKATKKIAANKVKISLKKIKGAKKYQIQISTSKKFKKKLVKKAVKKAKVTIKSNKIKNKKKLYIRVRVYKVVNGKKYYSKWSKAKKVKVSK